MVGVVSYVSVANVWVSAPGVSTSAADTPGIRPKHRTKANTKHSSLRTLVFMDSSLLFYFEIGYFAGFGGHNVVQLIVPREIILEGQDHIAKDD